MPTGSADSKAEGLLTTRALTAGKQSEARALVSQLLNLHVVWTGFSLPVPGMVVVVSALLWPVSCALGLPGDENVASVTEGLCQS